MTLLEKRNVKLRYRVYHVLRIIIASIVKLWCRLYYGNEGEKIPPITEKLLKMPVMEVAKKIRNGEITSLEVIETCIRRIKDVNPVLNCFVEDRFELALKEAKEADDLILSGMKTVQQLEREEPLLGVPFTTKDSVAVKGLHQTAGVVIHKDVIPDKDAEVIRLLRKKGAIIIGLTNVSELCMWYESHNHVHGRCNNPHNTTRTAGGSSGGEGSIQAAAGSFFGIGSDIGGSIRMPSFMNGVFGHKPSRFTVSFEGLYPMVDTDFQRAFQSVGPICRYASDLKPILNIIAGDRAPKLKLHEPVDLKKLKFFYQFDNDAVLIDRVHPDIIAALKKVIKYLKVELNIQAQEKKIPLHKSSSIWMATIKFNNSLGPHIMNNYSKLNVIKEIAKNAVGLSNNTFIALLSALYSGPVNDEKMEYYTKLRDELENCFTDLLKDDGVLLFPVHPIPAPFHNEAVVRPFNLMYTGIINCLGLPATAIPLGLGREGLPIGIQVIASHDNDRLCLAVAEELEKAFGGWVEPQQS